MTIARVIARAVGGYAASKVVPGRANRNRYAGQLFAPTRARVVIDGQEVPTRTHDALHAGAFDVNLGGVIRIFPRAREPGVLHFQAGKSHRRGSSRIFRHWWPAVRSAVIGCATSAAERW